MHTGTLIIYLSLAFSISLFFLICISFFQKKEYAKATELLFYASGLTITVSVILLVAAFLSNRFELSYVYNYSSKDLPFFYKLTGLWAGQEGTFLLWTFFLFIFGSIVINRKDDYTYIVLSIVAITNIFLLTILAKNSPFDYIWKAYSNVSPGQIPADGSGLNPLLQDPWMIVHPPVLFLGYASATIPYAYALAGLIRKDYSGWVQKAYRWVIFSTTTLGIGIFLGAYWAYKVLGWGGYWGWDPVENSSLIPWLAMIALLHGLMLQGKKRVLIKTNIFLTIVSLVLVFYGTFLTRSGILSNFSVHSFSDSGLNAYLIFCVVFFLFAGIYLFIMRFRDIKTEPLSDKFLSANNIINYGIILLLFFATFVLIGTSMPILSKIFLPDTTSVNEKFYNIISIPLGVAILFVLIAATVYRSSEKRSIKNIIIMSSLSVVLGLLLNIFYKWNTVAFIFSVLGIFIAIQNITDIIRRRSVHIIASRLSHLGIGIMIIGIITSNIHSYSVQKNLVQDVETEIESLKLTYKGIDGAGITSLKFLYKSKNFTREIKTPYYISSKMNSLMREPYIDYGFFKDIYISPVEYKNNAENYGRMVIAKGEEKSIYGYRIKFTGYDTTNMHRKAENTGLFVLLDININGRDYTLKPGLTVTETNHRHKIDAFIPGTKRRISLLDFDIANRQIMIYVEPVKNAAVPPDSVIVDISFKRLVWLVWLGTILIAAGGVLALKRRKFFTRQQQEA